MKKIKVTQKQLATISKIYRIGGFILIVSLLLYYSYLIDKLIEFIFVFMFYFTTKGFYQKQWHSSSLKECFLISLFIFSLIITFLLNKYTSIVLPSIMGLIIAFISFKFGIIQSKLIDYSFIEPRYNELKIIYDDIQNDIFNIETCTKEQLIKKCLKLSFSQENIDLAIDFFIYKTKHSIIADKLFISETSVTIRKKRMKDKLNK